MKYRFPWQKAGLMDTPADLLNSFKTRDESHQQQGDTAEHSGMHKVIRLSVGPARIGVSGGGGIRGGREFIEFFSVFFLIWISLIPVRLNKFE